MQTKDARIEKLKNFKSRVKFSNKAWEDRGLNPSDQQVCEKLESMFNLIADKLIDGLNDNRTGKQLNSIFKNSFKEFSKNYLDTEEKEFVCDLLNELAELGGVDIKGALNKWMYGSLLTAIMKFKKLIIAEKIKETIQQPCAKCGIELKTYIIKREDGIPDTGWLIAKCNNCKELNLISPGPNIKQLKFGNYKMVNSLSRDEYTSEQAVQRFEQIKFLGKY